MLSDLPDRSERRIDWIGSIPFLLVHLAPIGILWTGFSWRDAALCAALYFVRMFFITAGYHRYFSHRSYKMGRVMQFVMAFGGGTATQKGALWWAAHHRHHHKHSDDEHDVHSPRRGFWWSHIGWIMCPKFHDTRFDLIKDFARYPELRFLDRHHWVPPLALGLACWLLGGAGALSAFLLSTVLLYHGVFVINSLTHVWGSRRYQTSDDSRNNLVLALITLGEGWHNNHHHYQRATRQGFYWWEIDVSYWTLRLLAVFGLVWSIHEPPELVKNGKRLAAAEAVPIDPPAPVLTP